MGMRAFAGPFLPRKALGETAYHMVVRKPDLPEDRRLPTAEYAYRVMAPHIAKGINAAGY